MDVPSNFVENLADTDEVFRILLIVVTTVFGSLLVGLAVIYFLRTRSLNRQLKAYSSATDFGETDSNVNRRDVPTTNVFSVEGSNPVRSETGNNTKYFDNLRLVYFELI